MPDITAIAAGLESLKSATDIVKYLRSVNKDFEHADFKLKLADLAESLAEVKLKLVEAQEENIVLRQKIAEQSKKQDLRALVRLDGNIYLPVSAEVEGYGKGPWCSKCFDTSALLVALHHKIASAMAIGGQSWASYKWECPNCKSSVSAPNK